MPETIAAGPRMSDNVLERIPPFPTGLMLILRACSSEEASAAEIAAAVSIEEVLSARVVRAANAATLGAAHSVDNVVAAVSRLGSSAVRGIATGYFLGNTFSPGFARAGLDRQAMWRHNLAVAAASSGAAGGSAERANAYFAGLIHDVGKMIFAVELGGGYAECLQRAHLRGEELYRVEMEMLGTDHAEMGAQAAEQWNFAPDVVEAIRRHHQVLAASLLAPLASHVMVGNQVATDMGFTLFGDPDAGSDAAGVAGLCAGIGAGIMSRSRWALNNEMPRIEAMLSALDD